MRLPPADQRTYIGGSPVNRPYHDDDVEPELPFEAALEEAAIAYMEHCGFIHNHENGTFSNEFLQWAESAYWAAARRVRLPVEPAKTYVSDKPTRKAISGKLRTSVYERDEYACVQCGSRKSLNVDHIHPVALGGSNDIENLQTLCRSCNSAKGARV